MILSKYTIITPRGGDLKILNRGLGLLFEAEIWLKFLLFWVKKNRITFWDGNFLFFFFGGGGGRALTCSRYRSGYSFVYNSFKKKDGSTRYTYIKVGQRKGYFINSINGGGEKLYTADQMCNIIDFLVDNISVKFGGYLVKLWESLWERILLHCSLTCSFTHMKGNFLRQSG